MKNLIIQQKHRDNWSIEENTKEIEFVTRYRDNKNKNEPRWTCTCVQARPCRHITLIRSGFEIKEDK